MMPRSRRSAASSALSVMGLFDDAALIEIEVSKLAIGLGEAHLERTRHRGPAPAHFSERIFEAVCNIERPRYSAPRHRVLNRLAPPFGDALEHQARLAGVDIDFEIDRRKDRVVQLLQRGGEDLKDGGARLGVLTGKNPQQRAALRFIRSFVTTTAASPLRSWMAPGQRNIPTNFSPSRQVSP